MHEYGLQCTYHVIEVRGDHRPCPGSNADGPHHNAPYNSRKQFTRVHVENGKQDRYTEPRQQGQKDV